MNIRYRMLLWEQSRTAGVLCACIGAMAILLMLAVVSGVPPFNLQPYDIEDMLTPILLGALLVASVVVVVRQDVHAQLALDFEPRLLRLPARTLILVLTVFGMRLLFLCCLLLTLNLGYALLHHTPADSAYSMVALNLFLLAQACAWARRSITGLVWLVPAGLLVAALWLMSRGFSIGTSVNILMSAFYTSLAQFTTRSSLLSSIPATFLLAWLGVAWQRRDERHGLPGAGDVYSWLRDLGSTRIRPFHAPFDAQLWYEQRRIGRLLPLLTLLCTGVLALAYLVIPGRRELAGEYSVLMPFWFIPYFGLFAGALIAGVVGLGPRDAYIGLRPQRPQTAAMAILLIQARALFICFWLVVTLSILFMLAHGHHSVLLVAMLREGHISALSAAMLLLTPAVAAIAIAWILLWLTTLPFLGPILMMVFCFVSIALSDRMRSLAWGIEVRYGIIFPIILLIFSVSLLVLMSAWWRGRLSFKRLLVVIAAWQNVTILLLVLSPYLGAHLTGITVSGALAALITLPLVTVPLSLSWQMRSR